MSLLAPFAVIELGDTATFEDGSAMEAEIESYAQTAEGERVDLEEDFRAFHSAQAYKILASLRARIAGILEGFGIAVLPAESYSAAKSRALTDASGLVLIPLLG